jgi:uncharacterized protein YbaP (TraB family)
VSLRAAPASALLLVLALLALAPAAAEPAALSSPAPMAWLVKGDKASIYVLGTIHVGTAPPPAFAGPTAEAFASADTLLAELGTADYAASCPASVKLIQEALLPDQGSIADRLSPACKEAAVSFLGDQAFAVLARFKPWVLSLALLQAVYAQAGLDPRYGLDARAYELAGDRVVTGLDSLEDQLALLSEGTVDEQLASLEAAIPRIADGSSARESAELLRAYEADDRDGVARLLASSIEEGLRANPADKGSIDRIFHDRNAAWAKKLSALLEQGGDYFLFAGVGHFVGPGSVFDEMRAIGALK